MLGWEMVTHLRDENPQLNQLKFLDSNGNHNLPL